MLFRSVLHRTGKVVLICFLYDDQRVAFHLGTDARPTGFQFGARDEFRKLHSPNAIMAADMRWNGVRLTALIVLCLWGAACQRATETPTVASRQPQRIISVVPAATEMLVALGAADRIIAVSDFDQVPPEFGTKPRIGGLLNPNIEMIIQYKPDLVITYGSQEILEQRLNALGIQFRPFTLGNVEQTDRKSTRLNSSH